MKQHITETAINMVRESGLINLSRESLCKQAGIPDGSFTVHMGMSFTDFTSKLKRMDIHSGEPHDVVKTRTDPVLRKQHILLTAVELSKTVGWNKITRDGVADAAGVSMGLVTKYFSTMTKLRRDVMRYAVKNEVYAIIIQGLAHRDRYALKASPEVKERIAKYISTGE